MSPLDFWWYIYIDLLDLFQKLNVTPIILPVNSKFGCDVMGGGFPALVQAWISAGPNIIVKPLIILFFPFAVFFHPMMKNDVFLYGCRICPKFPFSLKAISIYDFCEIIMSKKFSVLSSPERLFTLWLSIVHVYGQLLLGIVVVYAPCPVEHEWSSVVVDFRDGEWWF